MVEKDKSLARETDGPTLSRWFDRVSVSVDRVVIAIYILVHGD